MGLDLDNFGDIWPPRNAGPEAEPWFAHNESRVIGLERAVRQLGQAQGNSSRQSTGKADVISDQITVLFEQQKELEAQQVELAEQQTLLAQQQLVLESHQESLEAQNESILLLFNSLPQSGGQQVRETGWTTASGSATENWKTIATAVVSRPANMNRAAVTAVGSASATSTNVYNPAINARILINGTASGRFEGTIEQLAANIRSTVQSSFFREVSGLTGSVTVQLQVTGQYAEFAASNIATLTVSVGFTRVGL